MPEYIIWLLSIVGTLCVLLIRHWLQQSIIKSNRYAEACKNYRSALLNIFLGLYPEATDWPQNIDAKLRLIFPELQIATEEFRHYLPFFKRMGFDRAWLKYKCATGRKIDTQCYHHYLGFEGQHDPKETFRENIWRMLSYAKETKWRI